MSLATLPAHPLPPFLADLASAQSVDPMFLGALVGGLLVLVTLADKVDSFVQRRRRTPPVDVDLSKITGSITSLTELVKKSEERITRLENKHDADIAASAHRTDKLIAQAFDAIRAQQETMSANFRTMENAVGRITGACEQINERLRERNTYPAKPIR